MADTQVYRGQINTGEDIVFSQANPEILGGDTDGVFHLGAGATNILGGFIKLYGDTHGSKAGDIELGNDSTVRLSWDLSESNWDFKGEDVKGIGTLVAGAANINGALVVSLDSGATNTVTDVADFTSTSTGTPASGIGVGITFNTETAAGNTEVGGAIRSIATDVDPTNEDFDMVFNTMLSGDIAAEWMRGKSDKSVILAGTLTVGGDASITRSNAGGDVRLKSSNTDTANGVSDAVLQAEVGGDNGGDPYIALSVSGTGSWILGLDNNDSDTLKFSRSADLSSAGFELTTGGNVTVAGTLAAGATTITGTTNDGVSLFGCEQFGTGRAANISRNIASGLRPVVSIIQAHASGGAKPALLVQQVDTGQVAIGVNADGSDTFSFSVKVDGTAQANAIILAADVASAANDTLALGVADLSGGNTMLVIRTEGTPEAAGAATINRTVAIEINGNTRHFMVSDTAAA